MVASLPDLPVLALLCVAALLAGWVDAVTGGGGLVQLPSLLLTLPQASTVEAIATNKLSSVLGTSAATATYARSTRLDVRTALPMAVAAMIGAASGAALASRVPSNALRPVIIVALIGVWVWTAVRPNLGRTQELRWQGQRRHYVVATGAGLAIGFYDGVIGPGTGSFLLIVLVAGLGYSFLQASATAKVVNLTTNVAALIVFGIAGIPLWGLGIMMGVFNILGAVIGARMAISRGSGFVRVVFLVVVAILIFRLGWDQVRTD
jgi:hypothetical protein